MASPIEVVSCKFLRYNCDHPVFQKEYTRSNRKAGTKILRCFPHCCPEHATRCYCGCSIHILVTFRDASIVNDSEIIVCARFEASSSSSSPEYQIGGVNEEATASRKLALGEPVVLPPEMLQPMPQDSVESMWIRAYREGEGKQQSVPENSIIYVMNNYRFPKWYYGYESGSTKSQREMKHYLRAYVLRLERPVNWGGACIATVGARHSSPGFTLISYRRASWGVTKVTGVEETARLDSNVDSDCDGRDALDLRTQYSQSSFLAPASRYKVQASHLPDVRNGYDNAEGILLGLRYASQREINLSTSHGDDELKPEMNSPRDGDLESQPLPRRPHEMDEKIFWRQPKYANTIEYARELSIIQYFVAHAAADELWDSIVNLQDRVRNSWIKSLYNITADQRSLELLEGFSIPTTRRPQYQHEHLSLFRKHPVLALCAQIAVEFVTSSALQARIRSTLHVDFSSPSKSLKPVLREQFAALVDGIYAHLSAILAQKKDICTVKDLVDELVTLVHQHQRFQCLKIPVRELLGMATPDTFALEAFCAQAREFYMASRRQQPHERCVSTGSVDGLSRWNQRWLLNSCSLRLDQMNNGLQYRAKSADDNCQFSAWELLSTIQQFGAIDVRVDGSASLRIESVFCPSQGLVIQPMHVVLDGKDRVFRTFPNGMSTMAVARDGWVYGDYFGYFEGPYLIQIWLFAYRNCSSDAAGNTPARCISVDLTLSEPTSTTQSRYEAGEADGDQAIQVSIKVDAAMCPLVSDDNGGYQNLMTLSCSSRHILFKSLQWKPVANIQAEYQRIVAP